MLTPRKVVTPEDTSSFSLLSLFQIIWGRKWTVLAMTILFAGLSIFSSLRGEDTYTADVTLVLEENNADLTNALIRDPQLYADTRTAVTVFGSRRVLERVVDRMALTDNPLFNPFLNPEDGVVVEEEVVRHTVLSTLESKISFETAPVNRLILVSATTVDPVLSAELADTVAEEFLADLLRTRLAAVDGVVEQLGRRVVELRQVVREKEEALQAFVNTTEFADPAIVEQRREALARVRAQVARLETEVATDTGLLQELDALTEASPETIAATFAASQGLTQLANGFGTVRDAEDVAEMRAALERQLNRNTRLLSGLSEGLAERESGVEAQSEQLLAYQQLERDVEASAEIYSFSVRRLNELSVQSGVEGGGGRIVLPAEVPLGPDGSGTVRSAIVLGLLGLFTGVAWVLIRETTNQRVRSLADLNQVMPNARAVSIPRAPGARSAFETRMLLSSKPAPYPEAVRKLRTALLQDTGLSESLVVHVTSDLNSKGKTTLSLGLARSFALLGKRVLVIDANMRQAGMMADILRLDQPEACLQDVITHNVTLEDAVQTHNEMDIDLLLAGRNRQDPADLMAFDTFESVISEAAKKYHIVLIDTPPLLASIDGVLSIKHADRTVFHTNRTVFVASARVSTIESLNDALSELPNGAAMVDVVALYGADDRQARRYSGYQRKLARL